jgi:hypothetical protein
MLRFFPVSLSAVYFKMDCLSCDLTNDRKTSDSLFISDERFNEFKTILIMLKEDIERISLPRTKARVERLERGLNEIPPIESTLHQLKELRLGINDDLNDYHFYYLTSQQVSFFNQEDLFNVAETFPKANEEIKLAGNCYATENYTACVFHLMRAVEIAVKAMVKTMNAQKYIGTNKVVNGNKVFQKKPIELCDWKTLIDGLKKALSVLEQGSGNSKAKKQKLAFYSHAIAQFGYFKDAWRNTISHGHEIEPHRKVYLQGETSDIMNQTKLFFQHLAKTVKE